MGQLALGVRSLLIRLVIFFIMAVLLAWALGGTLWPRPVYADAISASSGDVTWTWKVRVSSYDPSTPLTYRLEWSRANSSTTHIEGWIEVVGIVFAGSEAWTAGQVNDGGTWQLMSLHPDGTYALGERVDDRVAAMAFLLSKRP